MTPILQFFVQGIASPGGSKSAMPIRRKDGTYVTGKGGRIIINMVDAGGARNREWKKAVGWSGKKAMIEAGIDRLLNEPLVVEMEFLMKRPGHHYGSKAGIPYLRKDAPAHHIIPADCLKLCRSTEDALTSIVWVDDSTTIKLIASKRYAEVNENPGCAITISRPIIAPAQPLLPDCEQLPLSE